MSSSELIIVKTTDRVSHEIWGQVFWEDYFCLWLIFDLYRKSMFYIISNHKFTCSDWDYDFPSNPSRTPPNRNCCIAVRNFYVYNEFLSHFYSSKLRFFICFDFNVYYLAHSLHPYATGTLIPQPSSLEPVLLPSALLDPVPESELCSVPLSLVTHVIHRSRLSFSRMLLRYYKL